MKMQGVFEGGQNQAFGDWGEEAACQYLRQKGFKILDTKFRTKIGELDVIARDDTRANRPELIFVEVKTRQSWDAVAASELLSKAKQKHLWQSSQIYLQKKKWAGDYRYALLAILQKENELAYDFMDRLELILPKSCY